MSFEKYPGVQEKPKTPDKKERLFNFITKFCDYEVSVGVERGEEKIRGEINSVTKKAEVVITPEGIKAARDFFKKPETQEKINNFFSGLDEYLTERLERKRRERAEREAAKNK